MIAVNFANNLLNIQSDLLSLAYKLTSDRQAAHDLLQDTSLRALMNKEKYTDEAKFKAWVCTVMRNIFLNRYRKNLHSQTYIDRTDSQYYINQNVAVDTDSVEKNFDAKEIHQAVQALPSEYRTIFSMYVAGFKYREIAMKMNLPLGTVKSRIFFTRQRLQEELRDFR